MFIVTEALAGLGAMVKPKFIFCVNVICASKFLSRSSNPALLIPLPQFTVTEKVHSELWPFGATARKVLVVTPDGNAEPLAKPVNKNGVSVPAQLSVAVALAKNTVLMHGVPLPVTIMDGGQVTTGGWLSVTVTTIVQRRVLPAASVAWNTTLLLPTGKVDPLTNPVIRTAVPVVGAQLSVKVGLV
jgi:hypothetical protein